MKLLLLCGIAMLLGMAVQRSAHAGEPKVGQSAPDFTMTGSDGKTYKLADLRGHAVVLAWFPRAFTGGCTKECKSFREDGQELKAFNVLYFTASTDDAEKNKKFAESLGLDYPILSDPQCVAAKAYGVVADDAKDGAPAKRVTFIIDADGKLVAIDKSVKTETHGKDIAAKLKELGVKTKNK